MAGMKLFVAQPVRHKNRSVGLFDFHCIFVATPDPLFDTQILVEPERGFIAPPHLGGWMVDPALGFPCQRVEDLEGLNSLFAQSSIIKTKNGLRKRLVGEEGLHQFNSFKKLVLELSEGLAFAWIQWN